ncbi:MAG: vitamin B12-dependent ribonucleotide reductase [Dehalococcoidia bacterium]|nr:vitamin B12-dependent ribonucleotide reductase [Dehalococcoidia bacterium]
MTTVTDRPSAAAIGIKRFFTRPGTHPYDEIEWEIRTAVIIGEDGQPVFEQQDVEMPKEWSQRATNVVVSKYFRGPLVSDTVVHHRHGEIKRETSVRQLIDRVVNTITAWGRKDGYFATEDEAQTFSDELTHLILHQTATFNSPVWFNVGVEEKPQCSACFILSVEDTMDSILEWCRTEGMIFKGGSGSGVNLSRLRSSREPLSTGGLASGPVSFMRGADAIAGSIKSGGKTRRAAKMVILNAEHPDIIEFIECKSKEERKAYALGEAGYDLSLDGEAWTSIQFQNANNSVRATDEFMRAAVEDKEWALRAVTTGQTLETLPARDLLRKIAEAAWACGDPGMQFDTTINEWHTCPNSGRINASNPCSEYMHVDDSACNLASLNLMRFLDEAGRFDVEAFRQAVAVMITAQEIIVGNAAYPTPKIAENAERFRALGLGYANLGALLMALGLPYDSDAGRAFAAAVTALMTGHAYVASAQLAARMGPFAEFEKNRAPMLRVIEKHARALEEVDASLLPENLSEAARAAWDEALQLGRTHGYRNAQVSVLAPTGTIAFMMDCDTTGIEPDIALVSYKRLVGGGMIRMVNRIVPIALRRLGYSDEQIEEIVAHIDAEGHMEGAPHIKEEHLPVFDCALCTKGTRCIEPMGHVRMMAAVQPFISGAISKTVNLPNSISVDEVMETFVESWRQGLKAIAVYRDGSKRTQPVSTDKGGEAPKQKPVRRRLPDTRHSITHKFSIEGHEGYITVGTYEDGSPGEIFITMAKEGSTISGMMDAFATSISLTLQYGVPLKDLVNKFSHMRFEPAGRTQNREIPVAQSVVDYVFRWLGSQFLSEDEKAELGILSEEVRARLAAEYAHQGQFVIEVNGGGRNGQDDAPPCMNCGWIMTRSGTCYRCENCGSTSGCS